MRVAVVGAGVMGAATAWALRERGADVVVYEQFDDVDHERGSSHGRTRIYRLAYPDEQWVRLMEEALDGWRDLGGDVLARYGLVELAPTRELLSSRALDSVGAKWSYEIPDERVRVPDGWAALWQPEAGIVHADRARRAFLHDVEVRTGERVESPDDLDADVVVLAVGGWVKKFAPAIGRRLAALALT